ncbi:hypothetical protein RB620_02285 [Paenibacillus sp. LHD-117]|uniref:hypothetical protein n=1 Tax=Paenibacillus sp. LHD-117 TaxID=3071412 RepID=UPI0027E0859A|nr:hypothetical protein [Paenibacillus sp. LHD-117]MDQ6418257.1 hypothetical protein [Paenibacillus sp. LHD-117]
MPKKPQRLPEQRDHFVEWSDRFSRWLLRAVIILIALIALSQLAIQNDAIRHFLTSADRWEGTRLS